MITRITRQERLKRRKLIGLGIIILLSATVSGLVTSHIMNNYELRIVRKLVIPIPEADLLQDCAVVGVYEN